VGPERVLGAACQLHALRREGAEGVRNRVLARQLGQGVHERRLVARNPGQRDRGWDGL
jgi:hypothetical protein